MKKVGVVLAGCGVFDGSEIHEAVLTLLFLSQMQAEVQVFAPDKKQLQVINHATQQETTESRNVLVESARIARGNALPLEKLDMAVLDAVIFPGGFGAAKNLCTFAFDGPHSVIDPAVARVIREAHRREKPIGAMCIAPVLVALAFKETSVRPRLSVGSDREVHAVLAAWQAETVCAGVTDVVVDEKNKIVTTPAYMLGQTIAEVAAGIEKLVQEVLRLA